MPITAAGIAAAGEFLGGLGSLGSAFGGSGGESKTDKAIRRYATVDPFGYPVASAKKHGLHPLFALGGSGSISPSAVIPGQDPTMERVGRGLAQMGQAIHDLDLKKAQVNAVNAGAHRDAAEAALLNSRRIREQNEVLASPMTAAELARPAPEQPKIPDMYQRVRNNLTGEEVWLPNPDLGLEMPESLGAAYWARGKAYDTYGNPLKSNYEVLRQRRLRGRRHRGQPHLRRK